MKLGRKILLMLSAILATTVVAAGIYLTTTYNYATGELSKTFRVSKVTSGNSKAIQQTKPITILLMVYIPLYFQVDSLVFHINT